MYVARNERERPGKRGVFAILAAYGCSEVAMRKNRNDRVWAALGAVFNVLPLIVLLALPAIGQPASIAVRDHTGTA